MFSQNFSFVILFTIVVLIYNPFMTTVFISQRFNLEKSRLHLSKKAIQIIVFFMSFCLQYVFKLLGDDPSVWLLLYFITITTLVIWDRSKKQKMKQV